MSVRFFWSIPRSLYSHMWRTKPPNLRSCFACTIYCVRLPLRQPLPPPLLLALNQPIFSHPSICPIVKRPKNSTKLVCSLWFFNGATSESKYVRLTYSRFSNKRIRGRPCCRGEPTKWMGEWLSTTSHAYINEKSLMVSVLFGEGMPFVPKSTQPNSNYR